MANEAQGSSTAVRWHAVGLGCYQWPCRAAAGPMVSPLAGSSALLLSPLCRPCPIPGAWSRARPRPWRCAQRRMRLAAARRLHGVHHACMKRDKLHSMHLRLSSERNSVLMLHWPYRFRRPWQQTEWLPSSHPRRTPLTCQSHPWGPWHDRMPWRPPPAQAKPLSLPRSRVDSSVHRGLRAASHLDNDVHALAPGPQLVHSCRCACIRGHG